MTILSQVATNNSATEKLTGKNCTELFDEEAYVKDFDVLKPPIFTG